MPIDLLPVELLVRRTHVGGEPVARHHDAIHYDPRVRRKERQQPVGVDRASGGDQAAVDLEHRVNERQFLIVCEFLARLTRGQGDECHDSERVPHGFTPESRKNGNLAAG